MNALFVCTGNICRSVMAEFLFRRRAAESGRDWEAKSCGVAAERYFSMPEGVHKALARYGIASVSHQPQLVSRDLAAWATDIFAMTHSHQETLIHLYPEHAKKIHLFLEYAGLGARDVEDPIGKPLERYIECCDLIEQGAQGLFLSNAHANTPKPPRS